MAKFKLDINRIGGLGAGAIGAKVLNKPLQNLNPKLRAAGKVAAGIAVPMFIKRNPFMQSVGDGMIAAGVSELVGSFVPALAGDDDFATLGAMEDYYLTEEEMKNENIEGLADDDAPTLE